ncbi:Spermidine synthase [Pseudonocardia sp. Ae168_Ps1]|uniref:adenosylmethionine decarboxylase n=1 Tax=unclassified Pseudonocardia TaxID=2619320 RepID=UPI00095ACE7A|nr:MULTISPECIES: adenosylmethionine decarboxylase [unclassified Pseudonocardia]OLL72164.1 Spermidine synthase [Pseudonocardia sp. Ae150A_Ps1]OLL78131.1 Spermidine synthase [Pseudonocardia sp. Ae168_Ps1]OLL87745.1 Spermidine synthase [Pseudonocardia sp. Ae263_Ps1]OLL92229.1 Spermidine synthase [Pseudonocardia sp. Ae356_Ps1]
MSLSTSPTPPAPSEAAGELHPSVALTGSESPALPSTASPVGRHVLAELGGIAPAVLDDVDRLRTELAGALTEAGAQVRQIVTERFEPQGATVVAVLAESHASIHTWPEHGGMHVDVFTCGESADPVAAVRNLAARVDASDTALQVVDRGGAPRTVTEPISDDLTRRWQLGTVHHVSHTGFQKVVVADTAHGVTLFCDDERQSAEHTQLTYHEALVWPGALLARTLDRVLIVGSSEGVASEMAVAAGARHVDHVDIDTEAVRICAEHLPYGYTPETLAAAERGDGPVRLTYADGRRFVLDATEHWDLILVDLPDERPDEPDAQINRLYDEEFVRACSRRLTEGGVLVFQAGSPAVWRDATLHAAWQRFRSVFGETGGRGVYIGCEEHEWAFLAGVREPLDDPGATAAARLAEMPSRPALWDEVSLRHRLVAPLALRRLGE